MLSLICRYYPSGVYVWNCVWASAPFYMCGDHRKTTVREFSIHAEGNRVHTLMCIIKASYMCYILWAASDVGPTQLEVTSLFSSKMSAHCGKSTVFTIKWHEKVHIFLLICSAVYPSRLSLEITAVRMSDFTQIYLHSACGAQRTQQHHPFSGNYPVTQQIPRPCSGQLNVGTILFL